MNILVADALPEGFRAELHALGHHCTYAPELGTDHLADQLPGHEVLIVRSTKVGAETLAAASELRLVVRAGSGTNTIDVVTATERGIAVANVPGRNAVAVAELAMGLLLAIDRQIPDGVADARAGQWNKKRYSLARGIMGRHIGVLGLGEIGMNFAERAAAFGANVYAVTKAGRSAQKQQRAETIGVTFVDELTTLARRCDVLSLHMPSSEENRGIIGRELLAELPQDAILLNTARGELIDEQALLEALDAGQLRAGLDVHSDEPSTGTGEHHSRLLSHPRVYGTHHIGASTEQAQQAIAEETLRIIADFGEGEIRHCVNPEAVRGGLAVAGGVV